MRVFRNIVAVVALILALTFMALWVRWDVLRDYAYPAYVRVNILDFEESHDFGFLRDPLFLSALILGDLFVFATSGAFAAVIERDRPIFVAVGAAAIAVVVGLARSYLPRALSLSPEYQVAFLLHAVTSIAFAYCGAHLAARRRGMAAS